ncbi:Peroxisomal acyl-coenzyme A oxidase 1 [Chionoecetes opilio]|uniref:Peroxisomal acyl-coenzyme A oxidase 1 n=1 Tax=Chionoecetes opilio TaxID=41210 RepID=A0A8J4YA18_CHIOP|nr:Peroxisomal acyl-coenzyme A oxidase 1 [Chionoecetes opilio]
MAGLKGAAGCVEELRRERAGCSFNTEELTNILDGGKNITTRRREIEDLMCGDPVFKDEVPTEYLSHEDRYTNEVRKVCHLTRKMAQHNISSRELGITSVTNLLRDGNPLALHQSMFTNAVLGLASPEQQRRWVSLAQNNTIIGTYVQTELGHGTFIRGLETTATYDPKTEEFILHTPTVTATKWWPGGLGKTCNAAIVMAQLHSQDKCRGPHPFFVQLRDFDTHHMLPDDAPWLGDVTSGSPLSPR